MMHGQKSKFPNTGDILVYAVFILLYSGLHIRINSVVMYVLLIVCL